MEMAAGQENAAATDTGTESPAKEILDKHTIDEDTGSDVDTRSNTESDSDDGSETKGYAGGKFKTIPDLEKGYQELRKELGRRPAAPDIPEEYSVHLPEDEMFKDVDIPDDDPLVEAFKVEAKEMGLTQEQFDRLVAMKVRTDIAMQPNHEETIKSLGKNGAELIIGIDRFFKGKLSEESYLAMRANVNDAGTVKMLAEVRDLMKSTTPPRGGSGEELDITEADAQAMLKKAIAAEKAYDPEAPKLRAKAKAMFQKLYPDKK